MTYKLNYCDLAERMAEGSAIHGRPWLPSRISTLTDESGLQLYLRPVDASTLAGLDGTCGLTLDYPGGL